MAKTASRSFGKEGYKCKKDWPDLCGVQCGDSGIVIEKGSMEDTLNSDDPLKHISDNTSYITAFFEAFPQEPKCFIRGEGKTIEEAEEDAWGKYEKIANCKGHEYDRRKRKDGYAWCVHCDVGGMVFEPLTKCCVCHQPSRYTHDINDNWYCEDHDHEMPEELMEEWQKERRSKENPKDK